MKHPNYTEQEFTFLTTEYKRLGNAGLPEISDKLNKPIKSLISKLAHAGLYAKQEPILKTAGAGKKQLLLELEEALGFDTTGFLPAKKDVLQKLYDHLKNGKAAS